MYIVVLMCTDVLIQLSQLLDGGFIAILLGDNLLILHLEILLCFLKFFGEFVVIFIQISEEML